jgi:uncharacterized protein DUF4231
MGARKSAEGERMRAEFREVIEGSLNGLDDLQRRFLLSRWLDQVLWMEARADKDRNRYYLLRLLTIVGGVIVPALVTLNINRDDVHNGVAWVTFAVSLVVAVSAAIEEFFHYGDRWRHYRRTVEGLKIEGWQFFELVGPYANWSRHADAFPLFATTVEGVLQRDVETYITRVVREKEKTEASAGTQAQVD